NYSKPAPRQEICQLEIEQLEYRKDFSAKKLRRVTQMIVQAGNQEYQLGVKEGLSESEIEWLATEVSQWLGLKIIRTLTDGKKKISM
ncbi:serine/threonine protein kinase, partial [filamentous cyanobacterium Phorm 46]